MSLKNKKYRVFMAGFEEFTRIPLPQPGVFIAHDFSGRDKSDNKSDAPRQVEDYRLAYEDGLRDAGYTPVYAPVHAGTILQTLCKEMINTDAGIFDVSFGRKYNANVLIELGISLGLNHTTLVVAEEKDKPLLDFLEILNPLYYKDDNDLAGHIGKVVGERLNDFNKRISKHYCVICQNTECRCRKNIQQDEKRYWLVGADDQAGILRDMKQVAKTFQIEPLDITDDHHTQLCNWLYHIRKSRFVLLYSQELGKRHHGIENASTMVQLGMAVGAAIPWRIMLKDDENVPTDVTGYIDIRIMPTHTLTRSNLEGAIGALKDLNLPYLGVEDILPMGEYVEEEPDPGIDMPFSGIPMSSMINVPPMLEEDIPQEALIQLKNMLFSNPTEPITISQLNIDDMVDNIIIDTNMTGFSRTSLITAVCYQTDVREYFDKGICWINAGNLDGEIIHQIHELHSALHDGDVMTRGIGLTGTIRNFMEHLQYRSLVMTNSRILFVIDNPQAPRIIQALSALATPKSVVLFTEKSNPIPVRKQADEMVMNAIQSYKQGNKSEAKDLLLKTIELDEYNENGWLWLSAVVDNVDDQTTCLENVLIINPNNENAKKGLEVIRLKDDKSLAGAETYLLTDNFNVREYFDKASSKFEQGDFEGAIFDYNEIIQLQPNNSEAFYRRGLSYWNLRRLDEAISDYTEAIRLNPLYVEALYNRAIVRGAKGDLRREIEDYDEAIFLNPQYYQAYNNRGASYIDLKQYDKALADTNEAISLKPDYTDAYYNRGLAKKNQGDITGALADYNKALEINPNYNKAYRSRGIIYEDRGDLLLAKADYQHYLDLGGIEPEKIQSWINEIEDKLKAGASGVSDPNQMSASELFNRAFKKHDEGDFRGSIEDYTAVLALTPNDHLAWYNRGLGYYNINDNENADNDYSACIRLNPDYINAYYNRGLARKRLGNSTDAMEDYDETIQRDPNYVNAYRARGIIFEDRQDFDNALADYNRYLELGGDEPEKIQGWIRQVEEKIELAKKSNKGTPKIFMVYRRTNIYHARAVFQHLRSQGFDCFMDIDNINSGDFENIIMQQIRERDIVIVILTPSTLERTQDPQDWLRRELEEALRLKKTIVPLMFEGFDWSNIQLPESLRDLPKLNSLPIPADYFDEAMERLVDGFLGMTPEAKQILDNTPEVDTEPPPPVLKTEPAPSKKDAIEPPRTETDNSGAPKTRPSMRNQSRFPSKGTSLTPTIINQIKENADAGTLLIMENWMDLINFFKDLEKSKIDAVEAKALIKRLMLYMYKNQKIKERQVAPTIQEIIKLKTFHHIAMRTFLEILNMEYSREDAIVFIDIANSNGKITDKFSVDGKGERFLKSLETYLESID